MLQHSQIPGGFPSTHALSNVEGIVANYDKDTEQVSFNYLIDEMGRLLEPSSGKDFNQVDSVSLMRVMQSYKSQIKDWAKYALSDSSRSYTRNGIEEFNGKANLLLLVWNPAKGSQVHDHADAHCMMKVLKGSLKETLYDWPHENEQSTSLKITRERVLHENQVAYIADTIGLHKIQNQDPNEVAVSLHLYTPPWASKYGCKVFNEHTGKASTAKLSYLYSNKGVLSKNIHADSC